ncbi:MAG: hypothetical protein WC696_02010 [Candidatus Methylopumilus sp.]
MFAPLKKIGDVRNAFSHNINAQLTEEKVLEIYASISQAHKTKLHNAYTKTLEGMFGQKPLLDNHFRNIYTILAVWLYVTINLSYLDSVINSRNAKPIKQLEQIKIDEFHERQIFNGEA